MEENGRSSDVWEIPIVLQQTDNIPLAEKAIMASHSFDREELIRIHNEVLDRLKFGESLHAQALTAIPMPKIQTKDPRCFKAFARIWANGLIVDEIQSGKILYGTLCVDPLRLAKVVTLLDDGENRAVPMSIVYHSASDLTPRQLRRKFSRGSKVAVPHPMLVRLDNASLCILIHEPDDLVPVSSIPEKSAGPSPELLSEACVIISNPENEKITSPRGSSSKQVCDASEMMKRRFKSHLKRVKKSFKEGSYEKAIAGADIALTEGAGHRFHFVKARALEALERYEEAYMHFKLAFDECDTKQNHDALEICKALYIQHLRSVFKADLTAYFDDCKPGNRTPYPTFVGPVEIKMTSNNSGRGLFATEDCKAGAMVLVCQPVSVTRRNWNGIELGRPSRRVPLESELKFLYRDVQVKANESPLLRKRLLNIFNEYTPLTVPDIHLFWPEGFADDLSPEEILEIDKTWAENKRDRVDSLVSLNACSMDHSADGQDPMNLKDHSCGFYLLSSFINHSCVPTASNIYMGKTMFVFAAKEINAGDEITFPYIDVFQDLNGRTRDLKSWGITKCNCSRCELELEMCKHNLLPSHVRNIPPDLRRIGVKEYHVITRFMEHAIRFIKNLLSPTQKLEWAHASYSERYLRAYEVPGLENRNASMPDCDNMELGRTEDEDNSSTEQQAVDVILRRRLEVLQAMQATAPGDRLNLIMCVKEERLIERVILNESHDDESTLQRSLLKYDVSKMAMEACISVFGDLETYALEKILKARRENVNGYHTTETESASYPSSHSDTAGTSHEHASSSSHWRGNCTNHKQKQPKKKSNK